MLPPFVCHHQPQPKASNEGYILAGHLHPYVVMRDRDGSRLRLASFIFGPYQAILPAFGGFTGGSAYLPTNHDRVFVIAEGEIVEVPTTGRRTPSSSPARRARPSRR
jgi:metallophosphoesterase superfamily enzyme